MNMELKKTFDTMVKDIADANIAIKPTKEHKLNLYGLYKQATVGDVEGDTPGFSHFEKRLKHLAWKKFAGLSSEQAMQQYIEYAKKNS